MAASDVVSWASPATEAGPSHTSFPSQRNRRSVVHHTKTPWESSQTTQHPLPDRPSKAGPRRVAPARFRTAQTRTHATQQFEDPRSSSAPGPRFPELKRSGSPFLRGPHVRDYSKAQQTQPGLSFYDKGPRNVDGYGPARPAARYLAIEAFGFDPMTNSRVRKGIELRESSREHKAFDRHPTASSAAIEYMRSTIGRSHRGMSSNISGRGRGRGSASRGRGRGRFTFNGDSTSATESDMPSSGTKARSIAHQQSAESLPQEAMYGREAIIAAILKENGDDSPTTEPVQDALDENSANGGVEVIEMARTEYSYSVRSDSPISSMYTSNDESELFREDDPAKALQRLETLDNLATIDLPEDITSARRRRPALSTTPSDAAVAATETEPDSDDDETSGADASDEQSSTDTEAPTFLRRKPELDGIELQRRNPYRFSPDSFAVGVIDHTGTFQPGFHTPTIESSIAFDARKKAFLIDVIPTIPEPLPVAMELIDASIRIEDIVEGGIAIVTAQHEDMIDVTMTITCRRPPQFFMPVLDEYNQPAYRDGRAVAATRAEFERVTHKVCGVEAGPAVGRGGAQSGFGALDRTPGLHFRDSGTSGRTMLGTEEGIYNARKGESLRQTHMRRRQAEERIESIGYGRPHPRKPESGAQLRWRRATEFDFSGSMNGSERDAGPINPDGDVRYKVNFWLTYRLTFYLLPAEYRLLQGCMRRLRLIGEEHGENYISQNTSLPAVPKPAPVPELPPPQHETLLRPVIISEIESVQKLPFSTRFLVEGLVSQGLVQSHQVERMVEIVNRLDGRGEYRIMNQVLGDLFSAEHMGNLEVTLERRATLYETLERLIRPKKSRQDRDADKSTADETNHSVKIRRAIITPTRMLLQPEAKEQGNSVLRYFKQYHDRFLRVQFSDEYDQLQVNASVKEANAINPTVGTLARVHRALKHGLIIAGRKYVFLAASASQLKEHSCWFFAELSKTENGGKKFGVQEILQWMGNLDKERVIAKHAARQGLVLSTTQGVDIAVKLRRPMDDIVSTEDPTDVNSRALFTFTDGVGRCAQNVADQAAKDLGFDDHDVHRHPSAIQFRLGGAKGVLCTWPGVKPREVFLRPSQIKFESESKKLHVVRISQFRKAFLNRQFCILFASLGVDTEVIKGLIWTQAKSIIGLAERVAARRLTRKDLWMIDKVSSFPIAALITAGFHKDPVVLDVCTVTERRMLTDLRWHARVEVDKGVYLMGVADESGLLEEGQVFCQYHDPEREEGPIIVKGDCAITRAPALHPGDIRKVKAVDCPALHSLVNVIVFNVKGVRDLPNMLGGGDLDGDDYTLIWDERFVKHLKEVEPADYTAVKPQTVAWVEHDDIKQNFVNHILNDLLGLIGNAHLAYCDLEGPFSEKCLQLCQIYSTAVDFAKTGVPAELPPDYRPNLWPDFMGKEPFRSYPGTSVLGEIFRMVETKEPKGLFVAKTADDIRPGMVDARIDSVDIPKPVLVLAAKLKMKYDLAISALMTRYNLTEMELLSGLVLKNGRRRRIRDGDLKDPMRRAYSEIVSHVLDLAIHAMIDLHISSNLGPHPLFAVAAYKVTYQPKKYQNIIPNLTLTEDDEPQTKLLSFAWIAWKELLSLPVFENAQGGGA